jgi:dolichyl-phosphate beta-glucosyltransferase
MAQPYLSVIIPAYNEAERLPLTLIDIDKHLSKVDYSYEILVVSDGSNDGTVQIVKNMMGTVKNLKLSDYPMNRGKGAVVRDGMLSAKGKIRLFTDADNSTSVDQFGKMMPFFKSGFDVVIGSRSHKGSVLDPPQAWYRQIPAKLGNLFIQLLLLPGLRDTQCGFKAFTEEAAERIFTIAKVDRWSFDVEVLSLAKKFGLRIKEIPVVWKNATGSKVRTSTYLKFFLEVIKIRLWLWMNSYKINPQTAAPPQQYG